MRQSFNDPHISLARLFTEIAKAQLVHDDVVDLAPIRLVRDFPAHAPTPQRTRINRPGHRPVRAENANLGAPLASRLPGDHFANVQAGNRIRLARRFQCDMGRIVGADEEITAGRRQLLHVLLEKGPEGRQVAPFPIVEHVGHAAA